MATLAKVESSGTHDDRQTMYAVLGGNVQHLILPSPEAKVMAHIRWGLFDELLTPAYWKGQAWQHHQLGTYDDPRLGSSLVHELAACLLGGYGMPAEMGLAAYRRIRGLGLLEKAPSAGELETALSRPFRTPTGGTRRYRFPRQKSRYLAACLTALGRIDRPESDKALRDLLLDLPGVGPKTASWIVRNHRGSDAVAIIDIHILRAGRHIGLFPPDWNPQRHYGQLESAFIDFAMALGVRTSLLDALMWDYMRRLPRPQSASLGGPRSSLRAWT